jgi:hypothetical protein
MEVPRGALLRIVMPPALDYSKLVGKRFGRLVVLGVRPKEETLGRPRELKCLCDCGRTSSSALHALRIGRVVSCGCKRNTENQKEASNQKLRNLGLSIDPEERKEEVTRRAKENHKKWVDLHREKAREYMQNYRARNPEKIKENDYRSKLKPVNRAKLLVNTAHIRAKNMGVPFSLTVDRVQRVLEAGFCEVTGMPFVYGKRGEHRLPWSPSLDRLHALDGYTNENVRVVVWIYNAAKWTFGHEDVVRLAKAVIGTEPS